MPIINTPPDSSRLSARPPLFAAAAFILLACAARAWLQFSTPLAPGMNGAYYFVQARSLIEEGKLGIPDLPLTFWLHAGAARLLHALTGWDEARAIVAAVKLTDSILPPLVALPLLWLGWRWQRQSAGPSAMAALAPAAVACLGAQALSMTGDFQKNSLALVWLAALAPATHAFLTTPTGRRALLPLGLLALLGLTHIGVLGAALIFCGVLGVTALCVAAADIRRRLLTFASVGLAVLGLAAVVTSFYDPGRINRLKQAIAEPVSVLDEQHGPGGRPGPAMGQSSDDFSDLELEAMILMDDPMMPGGAGGPPPQGGGGPGLESATSYWPLFIGAGGCGLVVAWLRRRKLPAPDFALAVAASVTTAVLGAPFYDGQKASRLMLIAAVPLAMTLSFLLARIELRWLRRSLGALLIAGGLISGASYAMHGGHATISIQAQKELQTMAAQVAPAERTLIVAHHGLEWWVAWTLHTHIAQPTAVSREDWQRYDRVLYLTEKRGAGGPGNGAPPRGGLGRGPESGGMMPPRRDQGGPGGNPGGGQDNAVPTGARTLQEGTYFRLSAVDKAPDNQPTDAEVQSFRSHRK